MLIRFVRMTFDPAKVEDFLKTFEASQQKIRAFKGCEDLRLLRDADSDHVLVTLSEWVDDDALQQYRASDLFKSTWSTVKPMFTERAVAYSNVPVAFD